MRRLALSIALSCSLASLPAGGIPGALVSKAMPTNVDTASLLPGLSARTGATAIAAPGPDLAALPRDLRFGLVKGLLKGKETPVEAKAVADK